MPVITVPVRVGIARVMVDAVGSLLADEAVVLRPEIDGRIQAAPFTEGQAAARGDVLIALDPAEYEADATGTEAYEPSLAPEPAALADRFRSPQSRREWAQRR